MTCDRILFLVSSMSGGGAERVAALLCNHWAAQGLNVTLMPTFSGRGECSYPLNERVKLDYLADRVGSTHKTLRTKFQRFFALRRAIKEAAPDVVVSFLTNVNVLALLASTGLSVPVVVSERSYPPASALSKSWAFLPRITYRKAATVVAQTTDAANWLRLHCPGSRVRVIANPLAVPLPACLPRLLPGHWIDANRRMILAVGRLDQLKGFDRLVDAFAQVAEEYPEWDVVILGEGEQHEALELRRHQLGLNRRVHLPGHAGNVADWYTRAELFVMSSHSEGYPNVLIEAMAHGLPVLSFDCDAGPRDIIRPDVDGLLISPQAGPDGLAVGLRRLMGDPTLRLRMGKEATHVRERFSLETISGLWMRTLRSES